MRVVHLHRHADGRVAVVLDIDAIRPPHVSLVRVAALSRIGSHRFPLGTRRGKVLVNEPEMIQHGSVRWPRIFALRQNDVCTWKLDHLQRPVCDKRSAHDIGPKPLVDLDIFDGQMNVAERDAHTIEGGEVRPRRSRSEKREHDDAGEKAGWKLHRDAI